ncbi:putative microtubule-associated protein futsch [Apostichopus japonicus]|uniref:Putative microtubule-associated protein futsch n=1 Tax=Stichopus japonicus TaxID=307972 RepID=A0A2G8JD67_STIJA|nr:putative microtubule-associated protein futsch [Apostichopus japonicus]
MTLYPHHRFGSLAAHWSKHEMLRRQQMKAQAIKDEKTKKEKQLQIVRRKEMANKTILRHQAVFLKICNERANQRQEKESQIHRALSAKLRRVSDKFERRKNLSSKSAGERQGMFPPIKNKGIKTTGFRDTMWEIESVLQDSSLSDDLCNYAQAKRTKKTKSQSSVTSSSARTSSTFLPPISITSDTSEPQDYSIESGVTKSDIATEDVSCLLDQPMDDSIVAAEVPLEGSITESSGSIDGSLYLASLCMRTEDEESLIDPCETVARCLVAGVFEEIAAENPEMIHDNNEGDVFAPDELYLDLIASYNRMNSHEDRLLSNNGLTINPSKCSEVDVLLPQIEETDTTEASVDLNIYQTAEKVVRGVLLGAYMYLKTTEELAHIPSMSSLHVEGESGTQRSSASSFQTTDPLMVGKPSRSIGEQIAEIESVTELLNRLPSSAAELRRSSTAVTGLKATSTLSSLVTNSRSITDAETDIEEEDESLQEEIIGIVENEVIAQEKSRSSLASYANLTEVYRENPDGSLLVEGGISERALEGPFKSMTESVLSIESLHITGSEEGGSTSSLQLNKSAAEEDAEGSGEATGIQYQSVIPVYHNSLVEISNELISQNLSAISNKPDVCSKFSVAHQASGKNSFRNVFRPDITYCEKSLQSIKRSIHQQSEDLGFLEEEEEFSEHSSKEKLITVEETEGVCYLPKEKAYQVHYESPTSQASIVVRENSEQEKKAQSCESSNSSDISPENKRGRRRKMKKRKHRKQSHALQ